MKELLFSLTALFIFSNYQIIAQNVGIGTSTPTQKLDIIGNVRSSTLAGVGFRAVLADPTGTLTIASGANSPDWTTTGNANTTPTVNFIGTTDARDFVTKTGGSAAANERSRILSTGEFIVNNTGVGLNGVGDVFSVYSNGTTNGSTTNTSAIGAFAVNGYSSGTGSGVYGENTGTGSGVIGNVSGGIGLFGQSNSATGFGGFIRNINASGTGLLVSGNNTALTYLVTGSAAVFAAPTWGTLHFISQPSSLAGGSAVWGNNRKTIITSFLGGAGVTGIDSALGSGVIGASYNGGAEGVVGLGFSADGSGVYAQANNGSVQYGLWGVATTGGGGTGNNSIAVVGNNTTSGTNAIGVLGQELAAPNGATRFAVFANGDMAASGTKPFVIDHPADPANKFLKHFAMESPEVLNMYRGNVTLDQNGEAVVQLPSYFSSINNNNFSYHLTPIGGFANVYVKEEVSNNQFAIAGGSPGMKVSWMLMTERNDPYLQQYPENRMVEVYKTGDASGKYLQPALFGQPETMGIYYKKLPNKKGIDEKQTILSVERFNNLKFKKLGQ